ncbi:conserved hypothetical protein [Desulfonatronospira thiodismutans ASO3-1]|uniref:Uncharacterized protein n=1 Tax=Desulfonatronospira thiodismutans ASO3-1 TaxID=555779 RepID=D6ST54_9BACT|nr:MULTISPECIES: hypothetical protein [Desulfonatronospira]EFI33870.1 conserved hypothetical protein [Desulfonatronospira thiodismutans ASO3-1]RQD78592.1 MAG: hypothetical protein D5S03_02005 [Desulfonatronospira sp. MSAO_Bac3]
MKTEMEIRMQGMQALINKLGLVETERFLAAVSRDRFNYTQWRRTELPELTIEAIAEQGNELADKLNETKNT